MDVPQLDTNLDYDDIQKLLWDQAQMIAIQRKHINKLEAIIRNLPSDANVKVAEGVNHK